VASWKKILLEGDAVTVNLGSGNLTQAGSPRTYDLNGDSSRLGLKGGIVQFASSSNTVSYQFDNVNGVFDSRSANGIRLSDGDNAQHVNIKPKSETVASYTITLPNAVPGAANKILESNATGDLSWIDTPSGSGSVSIDNYAENRVLTAGDSDGNIDGESNLTFDGNHLTAANRVFVGQFLSLTTNNNAIRGVDDGGTSRELIKCDGSGNTHVGNTAKKTLLSGVSVDAGTLSLSCGTFLATDITAQNTGLSSAGDHGHGSIVTYFGIDSGAGTTAGRVYYYDGSSWEFAASNVEAGNKAFLGMALGSTEDAGFLLKGYVNTGTTLTAAQQCFLGTQAQITNTSPSQGQFKRVMGHSVTTSVMYFNPEATYLEIGS
jgi:hypothetical protein